MLCSALGPYPSSPAWFLFSQRQTKRPTRRREAMKLKHNVYNTHVVQCTLPASNCYKTSIPVVKGQGKCFKIFSKLLWSSQSTGPPPPTPPKVATLESSGFLKVRRRTRSIHGQNSQRDRENRIRVGPIITCSRRSDFEMAHRCEREKQRKVRRGGLFFFSLSDVTACRCIHCLKRFW